MIVLLYIYLFGADILTNGKLALWSSKTIFQFDILEGLTI